MEKVYRVVADELGIYEAVDRACPQTDPRRVGKPDGSWLNRVGSRYPGATSYWTREGMERYIRSGLQSWHRRMVDRPLTVLSATAPATPLYRDEHQILGAREGFVVEERESVDRFLQKWAGEQLVRKVAAFVIRKRPSGPELLVFEQPHAPVAGIQIPAGTVEPLEDPQVAVLRELHEETGILRRLEDAKPLGEVALFKTFNEQFQLRFNFRFQAPELLPEEWEHRVGGGGEDQGLCFRFFWIPLAEARHRVLEGTFEGLPGEI